jgi:YggT family protein
MNALTGAAVFVIQSLVSFYLIIVLLRFVLQLVKANFYNPLSQFAVRATHPLLKPIRRVIPSLFGLDMSSLLLAIVVQALLMALVLMITYGTIGSLPLLLVWSLIGILSLFLKIFWVAMIIMVIVSWIAPGTQNPAAELAYQISEPILGGMDISPIFAFLAIQVVQSFLMPELAARVGMPQELWRLI